MKKILLIKLFVLLFVFVLTLANLLIAATCEEVGFSSRCDRQTSKTCQQQCNQLGGCADYYWEQNFCSHGICYERWYYECRSGYSSHKDCINFYGTCGVK